MAEALWEPNLGPDDLFETISQALLNVSDELRRCSTAFRLQKIDMLKLNNFQLLYLAIQAVDRDAFSGWGAVVYVIEKDKVTKRTLRGRMD